MKRVRILIILAVPLIAGVMAFYLLRPSRHGMDLLLLLPPEMDFYAVADIPSLGTNGAVRKLLSEPPGVPRDEDYERFIRETGFRYQSDLRRLALGKMGPDWAGAARVRLDRARVTRYLESQGAQKKDASGRLVYSFGRSRLFRLAFLDDAREALVAFTIGGDEALIEQIMARRSGQLQESAASELRRGNGFLHIPEGSKIWMVGNAEKLIGNGAEAQLGSLALGSGMLRGSQTFYVSLQPTPAQLRFRLEDYCDSPASAQRIASSLRGLLALLRAVPSSKPESGSDPISLLDTFSVETTQQSVVVEWQWDDAALGFLLSNSRNAPSPETAR